MTSCDLFFFSRSITRRYVTYWMSFWKKTSDAQLLPLTPHFQTYKASSGALPPTLITSLRRLATRSPNEPSVSRESV